MSEISLDISERNRLIDLLHDQRSATEGGERSGYGQSQEQELTDIDDLIYKLNKVM